jgi:outer membrane autotransporter protein
MTSNECATGHAVEALGSGNVLYAGVLGQTTAEAPVALDQLSGDALASADGALAEVGLVTGKAVLGRIDQSFASLDNGPPMGYAPLAGVDLAHSETNFWFTPYGSFRHADGDGNAPGSDTGSGGLLLGGDIRTDDRLAGAFLSLGRTDVSAASRNANIDSTDFGLGAYGGAEIGDFRLAIGGAYGRHQVSSRRTIAAPGLGQTLTASYGANTFTGFGELSRTVEIGSTELTPYGNAALVYSSTAGFTEAGGSAALTLSPASQLAALTTLGLTADWTLALDNGVLAKLSAGIGWQHGFGDAPASTNAFAGGTPFTVLGQGLPTDAAVLKTGLDFDLSADARLNFAYNGQIARESTAHAVTATLAVKF